jgi:hypothetical protein
MATSTDPGRSRIRPDAATRMLLTVVFSNKQHRVPQAADAARETHPKLEVDGDTVQLLRGQRHQFTRHLIRSALVRTAASTENDPVRPGSESR